MTMIVTNRTRGRRSAPDGRAVAHHKQEFDRLLAEREEAETVLDDLNKAIARQIEEARRDSVSTLDMENWLNISRQAISKFVQKHVDGKKDTSRAAAVPPRSPAAVPPRAPARRKRPGS